MKKPDLPAYVILTLLFGLMGFNVLVKDEIKFIAADNKNIQYTGRIDFSDPKKPRFWTAGVYIQAKFKGTSCEIVINDEELEGAHNYVMVAIDNQTPFKIKTTGKSNTLTVAEGLSPGEHTITICKNTEAEVGYLEFVGFRCEALASMPPKRKRKMEFIGDSITSGNQNDLTQIPCDSGEWYDQQNAYYSYGPTVALRKNFDFYEPMTVHESSLSPCVHAILASKLGYKERAYEFYLRTARLDLDDYNNDTEEGCHITSMAGTWMSVVKGFGGMRVKENKLHFSPFIPDKWKSYSFRIEFRNRVIKIKVSKDTCETILESGEPLEIMMKDEAVQLK